MPRSIQSGIGPKSFFPGIVSLTPLPKMLTRFTATLLTTSLLTAGSAVAQQDTIFDTAVANGSFTTLVTALELTGLDAPLDSAGNYTVFAPTDAAFAKLPPDVLNGLLANTDDLSQVLLYHVIGQEKFASDVIQEATLDTLCGQRVDVTIDSTGQVFIDDALIQITNIDCSNGVIHVIDTVLVPNLLSTAETADAAGNFVSLLTAVSRFPGIVRALADESSPELTVFAPDDTAFANVDSKRLSALLSGSKKSDKQLKYLLLSHVVAGRVYADQVVGLSEVTTLSGAKLPVSIVNGNVFIANARIKAVDIETSNGVVHVMEDVISPW